MNQEHRSDSPSEPPLSQLERSALDRLLEGERHTHSLDDAMAALARLAVTLNGAERTMAELTRQRIELARNKTDERLRWALPTFLMTLTLLMLAMVWLDAAGRITLKPSTLTALNLSLFGTVTTLLGVVVKFFFGPQRNDLAPG